MVSLSMRQTTNGRLNKLLSLTVLTALIPAVVADGVGILGAGKWLYKPVCAHTCRYMLRNNLLRCETSVNSTLVDEHMSHMGGAAGGHGSHGGAATTDPMCFLLDDAFLRTTALCIEEYCYLTEGDVLVSTIQEWWEGHLATGTIGDWSMTMRPVLSYQQALAGAHRDYFDAGEEGLPAFVEADWLNTTSQINQEDYIAVYNYQKSFQWGEFDHGYTR